MCYKIDIKTSAARDEFSLYGLFRVQSLETYLNARSIPVQIRSNKFIDNNNNLCSDEFDFDI